MRGAETKFEETSFGFIRRQLLDSLLSPHDSPVSRATPRGGAAGRPLLHQPSLVRASLDGRVSMRRRAPPLRTRSTIAGAHVSSLAAQTSRSYQDSDRWPYARAPAAHDFADSHWGAPPGMPSIGTASTGRAYHGTAGPDAHGGIETYSTSHGAASLPRPVNIGPGGSALRASHSSEGGVAHDTEKKDAGDSASADVAELCRLVLQAPETGNDAQALARQVLRDAQGL
jgi:hypothetical protein